MENHGNYDSVGHKYDTKSRKKKYLTILSEENISSESFPEMMH